MEFTIIVLALGLILIIYGLIHGCYNFTKAHEIGHAKAIEKYNKWNYPIYIVL